VVGNGTKKNAKSGRGHSDGRQRRQSARAKCRAAFLQPFNPLLEQIEQARAADLYPFYSAVDPQAAANGSGRPVVLVANDYLGLSGDRRVREAAREAITKFGTSRCSSPLAGGHSQLHSELQTRIASFLHQEAAALFASGYQANVGIVSSLMQRSDLIVTDLFNHASIVDGARLSGAEVRFFQHNSASHLEKVLAQEAKGRRVLVIVEGIYSADGDIARLPELCEVAHGHGALLMIDEAHSLGVLGKGGRGAAEHFDLLGEVDLIMGTMSKSLASVGGFVAADRCLVDAVAHSARALIFSAALPPAGAAAALAALEIIESEPQRRERLWDNAQFLLDGLQRLGFDTMNSVTPVIPIRVGDPGKTIEFAARLRSSGVLVCPAIPPMVQSHLSRVRAHVTAAHDHASLARALQAIEEVAASIGIRRVPRSASARRSGSRPRAKNRHAAELQRA
jgi:8-amino-7-oxononanoate synthase